MHTEPGWIDATAQAELVRRGEVTPTELVDAAIARIERVNPRLNAVILPLFEKARRSAAGKLPDGPFRGVPFLLKDLDAHSAGDPFHCGIRALRDVGWTEKEDSWIVRRFRASGVVILGKTNTPELGLNITTEPVAYGPSRNPWNPEHSTGGSSGGSAAAVASGMVPIAHASDGGGSIRIPAAECGLVGLKPSRGRVSLGPDYGEYWAGLVISNVVSRSVRDTATMLDVVSVPMPGDPYAAPAATRSFREEAGSPSGRLRIGVVTAMPGGTLHPDCAAASRGAARLLESLGHTVEESAPEALFDPAFVEKFFVVVTTWTAAALDDWSRKIGRTLGPESVEPGTWAFAEAGRGVTAPLYIEATTWLEAYTRRMAGWWAGGFDLLVTPTLGEPPPRLGELVGAPPERLLAIVPFTPPFNATGQPAISLPLHWNENGLPIGVQLIAAYGREDLLLRVAAELEVARPWAKRRPALSDL
jgi:amidase